MINKTITNFRTTLAQSMTATQSTIALSSITTFDGHELSASDLGDTVFLVVEPGAANMEIIKVDATSLEGNTFKNILYRGMPFYGDEEKSVPSNRKGHQAGSVVIISNVHYYYNPLFSFIEQYDGHWEGAAATYSELPPGKNDGEVRVTLDDSKVYVWSEPEQAWKLAGAGGGAGTVYRTDKIGSDSEDKRTFVMNTGSFPNDKYLQVYRNGVLMENGEGADYTTTNNNTVIFEYDVEDEDKITLLVVSVDLVASLWTSVDDNILPDVDDTYDIGSGDKRFKDLHLSGDIHTYNAHIYGDIHSPNIVDPDDAEPRPAKLIGGSNIDLANFTSLAVAGNNDGAITITIDDVKYENVSVPLSDPMTITHSSIVSDLQTAIRTATGNDEVVEYNVDHFEITGANLSQFAKILKLEAPTEGTDITGEGFLDLGENATEVKGQSNEYKLVRLGGEGRITSLIIEETDDFLFRLIPTVPSNNEVIASNGNSSSKSSDWVKVKELQYNDGDAYVRIMFTVLFVSTSSKVKLCVNDVEIAQIGHPQNNYLSDIKLKTGDKVQLYILSDNANPTTVSGFKICYTKVLYRGGEVLLGGS